MTRVRPRANQTTPSVTTTTTSQYDSLGRLLSITYSDGTSTRFYSYDVGQNWTGISLNTKGRLTYDGTLHSATVYSYDPMGRVIESDECAPSNCGISAYSASYTYDWLGNLITAGDGLGVTSTYSYSPANEVLSITSSLNDSLHPPNLVSGAQNGPFGPLNWHLGNGLTAVRQYDALGRTSGGWLCQGGSTSAYCAGGTQMYGFTVASLGSYTTSACDTALNQCNSYGYDDFGRLTSLNVNSGTPGNYTWQYDRWGNRWQQNGGWTLDVNFNTSTNQISSSGFTYDAAGNLLSDTTRQFRYDADGNVVTIMDSSNNVLESNTFDALNHMVRFDWQGEAQEFVYNPAGQHTSSWDVTHGWENEAWTYWGAAPVAAYAGGEAIFEHQDWLGTERARTTYNGSLQSTFASLPFGDGLAASGNDWDPHHFAGLDRDLQAIETDRAVFRQYGDSMGRW